MDIGATVCLARVPRCEACPLATACPSRGTRDEPIRKQSPFEGSFRQRRAAALRRVAAAPASREDLDREAVESLARDGLVVLLADGIDDEIGVLWLLAEPPVEPIRESAARTGPRR